MSQARIAALRAMAEQDVSPFEAEIARAKLAEMGDPPAPPRPPAPPAAGNYDYPQPTRFWFSTTAAGSSNTGTVYIRMTVSNGANW